MLYKCCGLELSTVPFAEGGRESNCGGIVAVSIHICRHCPGMFTSGLASTPLRMSTGLLPIRLWSWTTL